MAAKSKIVSLSIEEDLLARLDAWAAAKAYPSRSQAFAALAREKLDALAIGEGRGPVVATVTYVYDHHRRELMERIAHLQHEHLDEVVATMHVHLDHARCLEVLILRGAGDRVRALAERIVATRGVERGEISMSPAYAGGAASPAPHSHPHAHPHMHPHSHEHAPPLSRLHPRARPAAKGAPTFIELDPAPAPAPAPAPTRRKTARGKRAR